MQLFEGETITSFHVRCTAPGVNGYHGNGDIYDPENILEFRRHVLSQTQGEGVHFMMADGVITHSIYFNLKYTIILGPFSLPYFAQAFDAEEGSKGRASRQLYLCQLLLALYTARTGKSSLFTDPVLINF